MIARISGLLLLLASVAPAQEWGRNLRLKVTVAGESRKIAVFIPKNVKKNETLPLLVAIPNEACKSHIEIDQWSRFAYEGRFAVFSVDTITGTRKGWHYKEQLNLNKYSTARFADEC